MHFYSENSNTEPLNLFFQYLNICLNVRNHKTWWFCSLCTLITVNTNNRASNQQKNHKTKHENYFNNTVLQLHLKVTLPLFILHVLLLSTVTFILPTHRFLSSLLKSLKQDALNIPSTDQPLFPTFNIRLFNL